MITEVKIEGFQSLQNVSIKLGRVTTLMGDTDVGKSAVIRAIKALATNRSGEGMFHKGVGPIRITMRTDDGHVVTFVRESGKSAHYLVDGVKYDKTGREVPDVVKDITGIRDYWVDKDVSIRPAIQDQHEGMFLLQTPAATVSKTIGRVSNINIVFAALRRVSSDIAALQLQQSTGVAQLLAIDRDIDALGDVDARVAATTAMSTAAAEMARLEQLVKGKSEIADEYQKWENRMQDEEPKFVADQALANALTAMEVADKLIAAKRQVAAEWGAVLGTVHKLQGHTNAADSLLATYKQVEDAHTTLRAKRILRDEMERLMAENLSIVKAGTAEKAEIQQIDGELQALTSTTAVCPLTGTAFRGGCQTDIIQLRVAAK